MRTIITLDPEAERLLNKAMQLRGQSFEQALNEALLKGLADVTGDRHESPFEVPARPMQLRAGLNPTRLNTMADELETEGHADLTRQLHAERD